jgi:c-di-GMP-binding flagellar brake protein YcgR/CheY-like chemotaxis protein
MKKIIIISYGADDQEALAGILGQAPDTYELQFAQNAQQGYGLATENNADAIVYDLASFPDGQLDNLARLNSRLPYIPAIALINEEAKDADAVLRSGVSRCLAKPLQVEKFLRHIQELIRMSTSGQVRGIPVHSLLQMLESDEKTCTLKVQSKDKSGLIFVKQGTVVAAETNDQQNEDAIYAIIDWEEPAVELRYFNGMRPQAIQRPLISLIMESFRLKDERDSLNEKQEAQNKPRLELKHISTAGNRISLDIGAKIKLEFDAMDNPLVSTMVGMLPDEYLIVTTPAPASLMPPGLNSDSWIVVKYLHMGRLCMFRTQLLKAITDPHPLLFLDYPPAIHYHELRRAKRTSIFIPCTLHLLRGPELYGALIDLSATGCLCQIKTKGNAQIPPIDIETKLQLRCLLPGLKEDQELTAVVKNFRRSATETRVGLEFVGLQNYLKEVIEKYVYSVESIIG